jgi:hypothetical protein
MFELETFGFDTTLNHHLFQKVKRIEKKYKFNYLINILTKFTRHVIQMSILTDFKRKLFFFPQKI